MMVSLLTSGFCSSMESAYLSLDRIAINKIEKSKSPVSRLVLFYLDHLNGFITSILIFNLLSNIMSTLSANTLFFWYLGVHWEINLHSQSFWSLAWEIAFVVIFTLIILIFSEFVPKRITILHPKFFAEIGSIFMMPVYTLLYPVVFLIFRLSNLLKRLFMISSSTSSNSPVSKKDLPIYRHELLGYVDKISSQGGLHKLETDWLVHLFFYMNTPISSIMINRENLIGLDYDTLNGKNILPLIRKFLYSNIPIYRESKDNIIGIISKKEIALKFRQKSMDKEELDKYIRKVLLLPKNKNVMEVLSDIYHSDLEIALIVDEHGGVEGLVTANHIITCIFERVGNEENDNLKVRQMSPNVFSIRADVTLGDFNKYFGIHLKSKHYKTMSGYLLERFKYIPKKGESVEDENFVYSVKASNQKKIIRIEITKK